MAARASSARAFSLLVVALQLPVLTASSRIVRRSAAHSRRNADMSLQVKAGIVAQRGATDTPEHDLVGEGGRSDAMPLAGDSVGRVASSRQQSVGPQKGIADVLESAAIAPKGLPALSTASSSGDHSWAWLRRIGPESFHALAERSEQTSSGPSGRDGTKDILKRVGILFTVGVVAYFLKVVCIDLPRALQVLKQKKELEICQAEADDAHVRSMSDMVDQLASVQEKTAHLAELHFQEKFRGFKKWLALFERIQICEDPKAVCVDTFRDFVQQWLKAFEQCSLEPENKPNVLCRASTILQARTVAELARGVLKEAEDKALDLGASVGPHVSAGQDLKRKMSESVQSPSGAARQSWLKCACGLGISCGSRSKQATFPWQIHMLCLQVTVLSAWHGMLLWYFVSGILLAGVLHSIGLHAVGAGVGVAVGALAAMLLMADTLDEGMRQENARAMLQQQKEDMDELIGSVSVWEYKADAVAKFWKLHTMNRLDLFDTLALSGTYNLQTAIQHRFDMKDIPDLALRQADFVTSCRLMETLTAGMGEMRLYCGEAAIADRWLEMASRQTKATIAALAERGDRREGTAAGDTFKIMRRGLVAILVVRVVRARGLPAADSGGFFGWRASSTRACTVLHVDCRERRRTRIISDDLSPVWDEEFVIEVPGGQSSLTLEVFDDGDQSSAGIFGSAPSTAAPSRSLGFVEVDFRNSPGRWMERSLRLLPNAPQQSHPADRWTQEAMGPGGQPARAKLDFQVYFASCVKDLQCIDDGKDLAGERRGRFLTATVSEG